MNRSNLEKMIISNIRKYRLEKKLTQEELASRCNLQTGYIGGIETGKRFPKIDNLFKIAKGLEIDICLLISPDANLKANQEAIRIDNMEKLINDYVRNQVNHGTLAIN